MQSRHLVSLLVVGSGALLGAAPEGAVSRAVSSWVFVGADGHLHYKTDAQGNRIMDFSSAGYRRGGVALPVLPAVTTLSPGTGDQTATIQAAIDAAAKGTPDANGFRGASSSPRGRST